MHNILTESIFYIFNKKSMKIDNHASSILLPLFFLLVHFTTKPFFANAVTHKNFLLR